MSCLLILTSQLDTSPGTVTQVNVTATPASHNADIKQLNIFSLAVTIGRKPPFKKDDLENEDLKEKGLEKWQVILIIGGVTFSVLLFTFLLIFRINLGSKKRAKKRMNRNLGTRNQHQHHNFDEVIANRYA